MSTIGEHLASLRMKQGLTQTDVANILEISASVINRLEHGTPANPGINTILRYCDAIGARVRIELEDRRTA